RSVWTSTGSPTGTAGEAVGICGAELCGVGAVGEVVEEVAGVAGVLDGAAGIVVAAGCATFGASCFCHASHRRSAENENTTRAMRRWVSIMIRCSGRWVEATVMPRVALGNAPHREPRAAQGAMRVDCVHRVFRACRGKAALAAPPRAQE